MKGLTRKQIILICILPVAMLACLIGAVGTIGAFAPPSASSHAGQTVAGPTATGPAETITPVVPSPTAAPLPALTPPGVTETPTATAKPTVTPKPTVQPTTRKPSPKPTSTKPAGGFIIPGAFCSTADHNKVRPAANGHLYRCSLYTSGTWHWKRI